MPKEKNKKTVKKIQKNSKEQSDAGGSAVSQPSGSQTEKKKGKGCLVCGIIAIVLVILLIVGLVALNVLSFWFPPTFLFGLFSKFSGIESISQLPGSDSGKLFGGKNQPIPNMEKAVSKLISAKDGGTVEMTTESGLTVILTIPSGSLEEDTEIVLAPNENDPEEEDSSDPAEEPGVTVGPSGTNFDPAATISFSFVPSQTTGNVVPGAGQGSGSSQGQSGTTQPPGRDDDNSESRFPDNAVIVFTSGGTASPVPTNRSDDGSTISGPINGSGAAEPENPTEDEVKDMAEEAAMASGGTCTPEFIDAIKAMANIPDYPAGSIMARTLDDCLNLDWLREKCQNDPIALRRLYFQERLRIAAALQAPSEKVEEINRLMNECVARYEISASGSDPSLGAMMSATASLWVCGYLDDVWQGSMTYQIVPPELPGAGHYFSGTVNSMSLPPRGGPFQAEAAPDSHFGGAGYVDLSGVPLGLWGYFDGQSTLNPLNIYAVTVSSVPIHMTERPCIPLVPLTGGSN